MIDPTFTVLLPVVRPPHYIEFSMASVLAQTREDLELLIVCDGAPPETIAIAEAAAAQDPRMRVFSFPKGERHGEAHRHTALQQARGRYVCQIADDDLWFPDHLAEIDLLLHQFEFGNTTHTLVAGDGHIYAHFLDLADPSVRRQMLDTPFNFFGPTVCGYRMSTYRRMPVGWSPAEQGIWTDLAMWRKFLALSGIRAGTRFAVTSLNFPATLRTDWPVERRRAEIEQHAELATSVSWRDDVRQRVLRQAAHDTLNLGQARHDLETARRDLELNEKVIATLAQSKDRLEDELATVRSQQEIEAGMASAAAHDLRGRAETAEARIAAMESSLGWRLLAPFRRIRGETSSGR